MLEKASRKEEEKDVPLDEIAENVSSYFKKFSQFKKYEKDITKKYHKYYDTTEALPDFWPVKFINRAWRKTKQMHTFSGRKKCWSLAILFQVMKRSRGYDESEREAQSDVKKESQQSGGDPSANEPVYIRIPFSEMIDGKGCYRSDTDEKDKESKASNTVEKNIIKSPQIKEYKLIDKFPSPTQILQKNFYITLYDNQTRNAAWVYEILNKSTKANNSVAKIKKFKEDASVHPLFQPPTNTYTGTEYNRGHLAAAANHSWCQQARDDTYFISNIVPQQSNFNSGMWSKLEEYCREIAEKDEVRNVHVYTGPLYLSSDGESEDKNDQNKSEKPVDDNNDQIKREKPVDDNNDQNKSEKPVDDNNDQIKSEKPVDDNNDQNKSEKPVDDKDKNKREKRVEYELLGGKAVPTHLFKVIIVENKNGKVLAPECYKMPNTNISQSNSSTLKEILEPYKEKIEDIQSDSGLIFEESEVKEEKSEDNQRNSRLKEEITDETYNVKWRAKERGTLIEVRVSGSYTDHSDRAVLH